MLLCWFDSDFYTVAYDTNIQLVNRTHIFGGMISIRAESELFGQQWCLA